MYDRRMNENKNNQSKATTRNRSALKLKKSLSERATNTQRPMQPERVNRRCSRQPKRKIIIKKPTTMQKHTHSHIQKNNSTASKLKMIEFPRKHSWPKSIRNRQQQAKNEKMNKAKEMNSRSSNININTPRHQAECMCVCAHKPEKRTQNAFKSKIAENISNNRFQWFFMHKFNGNVQCFGLMPSHSHARWGSAHALHRIALDWLNNAVCIMPQLLTKNSPPSLSLPGSPHLVQSHVRPHAFDSISLLLIIIFIITFCVCMCVWSFYSRI